ncbi:hypothetical protein NDU88_001587 [Pleurodeles waltl]|uniref:Uncharacterized protein n=1 Tax=Pleurodeles waltl TaxID=8319 RepID=A0AAV7S7S3_PLEWA|nr:hypothetical protein NDU88_001587 [Pleurodeles waltl]
MWVGVAPYSMYDVRHVFVQRSLPVFLFVTPPCSYSVDLPLMQICAAELMCAQRPWWVVSGKSPLSRHVRAGSLLFRSPRRPARADQRETVPPEPTRALVQWSSA